MHVQSTRNEPKESFWAGNFQAHVISTILKVRSHERLFMSLDRCVVAENRKIMLNSCFSSHTLFTSFQNLMSGKWVIKQTIRFPLSWLVLVLFPEGRCPCVEKCYVGNFVSNLDRNLVSIQFYVLWHLTSLYQFFRKWWISQHNDLRI